MKKIWIGIAVLSAAVLVFGAASFAYAQSRTPAGSNYPHGPWMMGEYGGYGRGRIGWNHMGWNGEQGPMHEVMLEEVAEALDLSSEEIKARHDNGETIWEIAAAEGLSDEEIQTLMSRVHDDILDEAISSGWLSEEQAGWMDEYMEQMWHGEYGSGFHCSAGFSPPASVSKGK
jgi:hypothetical protein